MAYGNLTLAQVHTKRVGHGIKAVDGKIGWPAAQSACWTSSIEKYFRSKCTGLNLHLRSAAGIVIFVPSATKNKGFAILRGASGTASSFVTINALAATSGTFTAFGA